MNFSNVLAVISKTIKSFVSHFFVASYNKTINRICGRAPQTGYGKC